MSDKAKSYTTIELAIRQMAELIREQGEKITRLEQHEIRRLKLERERDRAEGYR